MTDLSLAEKVEGLTGPCRETDAMIAVALGHKTKDELFYRGDWSDRMSDEGPYEKLPHYTASLDAVQALIAENLPASRWGVRKRITDAVAWVTGQSFWGRDTVVGPPDCIAATPALALLAAFLRAKGEQNG